MILNCVVVRRLLRVPWTARRSNQSVLKEILNIHWKDWCWSWSSQYFGHLTRRTDLLGKTLMQGKIEGGMRKDEMVEWHHWLDGHELELASGVGDGQGGLACCSPWGCKELGMTERLNWLNWTEFVRLLSFLKESSYSSENYEICVCAFWWGEGMVFDWYKSHWVLIMNFKLLLGSNIFFNQNRNDYNQHIFANEK